MVGGGGGGAAVIHQFGFGTFNVAVSAETLAMSRRRPRGERFCCRGGGSRALLKCLARAQRKLNESCGFPSYPIQLLFGLPFFFFLIIIFSAEKIDKAHRGHDIKGGERVRYCRPHPIQYTYTAVAIDDS